MKISFNPTPALPNESSGLAVRYAPSRRQLASWRWRVLVLLVLSPLLLFLGKLLYSAIWADMPGFIQMEQITMKTPLSGRLAYAVPPGTAVKTGDVIAQLSNEVLEQERGTLAGTAPRASSIMTPTGTRDALSQQQGEVQRLKVLASQGAATQNEVTAAQGRVTALEGQIRRTPRGTRMTDANAATVARIAEIDARLQSLTLRATENGIVAQVFAKPGEWIVEGMEVASMRLDHPARVEAFVEPSWLKYANVNREATIHFLDGYTHRARVTEVKMNAQRLPPDRANPLTVRHHSVLVMLQPEPALPEEYQVNILPVNVQFDRGWDIGKMAHNWFGKVRERHAHQSAPSLFKELFTWFATNEDGAESEEVKSSLAFLS